MIKLIKESNKAILYIYGRVGGDYLNVENISYLLDDINKDNYSQIDIHLHTSGGSVIEGNIIYNFLKSFKGTVDIYIDGIAASMGAIIMLAGTKVHLCENGFIMIHSPSGWAEGTAKDFISAAKLLTGMEKNFKTKLIAKTGKSNEEVATWFDGTDHWFTPEEALAMGLIDTIYEAQADIITKEEAQTMGVNALYERFAAQTQITKDLITNNKINLMNKKELITRYGLVGVTEQSTDQEVYAALDKKQQEKETAQLNEINKTKESVKKTAEIMVQSAINSGKIKTEQKPLYVEIACNSGLDKLAEMLEGLNSYTTISSQINNKTGNTEKNDWSWDDYQKKSRIELENMPKTNPEKFKQLYKDKYGITPEI